MGTNRSKINKNSIEESPIKALELQIIYKADHGSLVRQFSGSVVQKTACTETSIYVPFSQFYGDKNVLRFFFLIYITSIW